MNLSRRKFIATCAFAPVAQGAFLSATAPSPYGAVPSPTQQLWSELEYYNFLHFTVNTFTDKEWGYGNEDPAVFNPTAFDADSIVDCLKASGSRGVILTCKHHDGFCLWPTKTTRRNVSQTPFRGGKGDVVREVSEAARRAGLKFGVYLSPWDRSTAAYGTPAYIQMYREQMRELLTGYGPIFEIWHDGANGGDGFYGGANEKRIIDKLHYYDWVNTWALERKLQPHAAIFSDVGPDVRWVGNEKGIAGETCWATYTPQSPSGGPGSPGDVTEAESSRGTLDGKYWMPAECDVSIRPGWFYHAKEDHQVRSVRNLMDLYYNSVGRGASFLLNVPPDRRGLIAGPDQQSLKSFGAAIRKTFSSNLAAGTKLSASHTRSGSAYSALNLIDANRNTYWATENGQTTATITVKFPEASRFDLVRLEEFIPLGQRIRSFKVETLNGGAASAFGAGTSIGMCRILRSEEPVIATELKVHITSAAACPALAHLGVHLEQIS